MADFDARVRERYADRRDAAERRRCDLGARALPGDTTTNKQYLASTIRSADSHNRRLEERKCWARRDEAEGDGVKRYKPETARAALLDERAAWAARKEKAFANGPPAKPAPIVDLADVEEDAAGADDAPDAADAKKERRKAEKKALKKEAKKMAKKMLRREERKKAKKRRKREEEEEQG